MKLELKHLSCYLPYELKIGWTPPISLKTKEIYTLYAMGIDRVLENDSEKPILRPLTELTKEIVIGKEKFVPIEVLFEKEHPRHLSKKYYTQTYYNYAIVSHNGTAVELKVYLGKIIEQNPRWIFEYLIRWNFDVFGLIDKNLAIDINTLKL